MNESDSERTPNIVEPEFLTVDELATRLRIGRTAAYALCRANGFPAIRVGGSIRIPIKQFNEWLESGTVTVGNGR